MYLAQKRHLSRNCNACRVRLCRVRLFLQRETGRTTTSMTMSTARAEATLAVLEAERAQLERRLKKVSRTRGDGSRSQRLLPSKARQRFHPPLDET